MRTIVVNKVEINRYSLSGVLIEYLSYFDSGDYTLAALSLDSFFTAQTLFAIKTGFSKETKIVVWHRNSISTYCILNFDSESFVYFSLKYRKDPARALIGQKPMFYQEYKT